jgi:GNAT superfamily N-acetyltransferase
VRERFTPDQVRNIIESVRMSVESLSPLCRFDPDEFVREIKVKLITGDYLTGKDEIGEASLLYINGDLARYHYNWNLFYVFDDHSQDLCDVYDAFFTDDDEWIDEVQYYEIFSYNTLYFDYLYLKPEYRGYGIGRILAMGLIEEFAKEPEIVIAWPVPVELQEDEGRQVVSQVKGETVHPKLVALCESLGFIRLKETNMLFLPTTDPYPSVSDILKKMFPEQKKRPKAMRRASGPSSQ